MDKDASLLWLIVPVTFIAFMGYVLYSIGYQTGHSDGWKDYKETSNKSRCEVNYSNTAYREIPGDCLKYFIIGREN